MFTLKNVAFSLGLVILIGMIECKPEATGPKPKVRLNLNFQQKQQQQQHTKQNWNKI